MTTSDDPSGATMSPSADRPTPGTVYCICGGGPNDLCGMTGAPHVQPICVVCNKAINIAFPYCTKSLVQKFKCTTDLELATLLGAVKPLEGKVEATLCPATTGENRSRSPKLTEAVQQDKQETLVAATSSKLTKKLSPKKVQELPVSAPPTKRQDEEPDDSEKGSKKKKWFH